jgi:hypothetical protein
MVEKTTKSDPDFVFSDYEGDTLQRIRSFMDKVNEMARDGLSAQEFARVLLGAIRVAVISLESLPLPGPDRKAVVIGVASKMFDTYAHLAVPLYLKPTWFFVAPSMKKATEAFASGAVEFLLPIVRESEE